MMNRSGTILIVDDDENDVSLISCAIMEAGLNNPIRWLRDGEKLIHDLKRDQNVNQFPFLVLIDWNMPKTNTLEILKWIRQQPEYLNLLIIVLTGSESPVEKQLAYAAGANWYFVKSVNFTDVMQLVQRIREFWLLGVASKTST
jgi:CheY-like chemotaxis protein